MVFFLVFVVFFWFFCGFFLDFLWFFFGFFCGFFWLEGEWAVTTKNNSRERILGGKRRKRDTNG